MANFRTQQNFCMCQIFHSASQFSTLGPQSRVFTWNPSAPSSISCRTLRPRGFHFLWVERVSGTRDIALERSRSTLSSPYSRAANRDDFDRMQRIMDRHDHSILLRLRNGTTSHVYALWLHDIFDGLRMRTRLGGSSHGGLQHGARSASSEHHPWQRLRWCIMFVSYLIDTDARMRKRGLRC